MVSESNRDEGSLVSKKQQFTYSEVITITNNFEKEVGKGGFGTVYHGHLDDTQVAVKMFSPSSIQGYKQFQAEVIYKSAQSQEQEWMHLVYVLI